MFSLSLSSLSISESSLLALKRAGFGTVDDLGSLTAEQLSEELKIPVFSCSEILRAARTASPVLTQPAASLLQSTRSIFSISEPVNSLLDVGGLKKGCILELSGPPGSPKEHALLELVKSVVTSEEEVLFLDAQNMTLPSTLRSTLKDIPGSLKRIQYLKCFSLLELMAFLHSVPSLLDEYPKISLLVLNTFSFLFHTTPLNNASRASLLEQIRTVLAKICASRHLTVVVTIQLATKMVGADGAAANFDTAKKAVMVPQLGDSYLPGSRSYRLVFIPDSPTSGMIRLLASPSQTAKQLQATVVQAPYEMVNGILCCATKEA